MTGAVPVRTAVSISMADSPKAPSPMSATVGPSGRASGAADRVRHADAERAEGVGGEQERPRLLGPHEGEAPAEDVAAVEHDRLRAAADLGREAGTPPWPASPGARRWRPARSPPPSGRGWPRRSPCASAHHAVFGSPFHAAGQLVEHDGRRRRAARGRAARLRAKPAGSQSIWMIVWSVAPERLVAEEQVAVEAAADDEHDVGEGDADAAVQQRRRGTPGASRAAGRGCGSSS